MPCPLGLLVYYLGCFHVLYCSVVGSPTANGSSSKSDEPLIDCNTLSYLGNSQKKEINALASFPGSGNSWLRQLLQRSTGLLTGSVYRDYELESGGLPGVHDSSVLLVKTHQLPSEPFPTFDRAVVLIRNPFKTLLAEFNRRAAGHLGYVPITNQFLQRKDWVEFVLVEVKNWTRFYIKWLDFKRPLLLVNYENLLLDAHCQLERIIHFLNQPVYQRRLFECSLSAPADRFKRAQHGHLYPFDPFSIRVNGSSLRKLVDRERRTVYRHIEDRLGDQLSCERSAGEQGV